MKKLVAFSLVLVFLLSLAACSANKTDDSKPQIDNNTTNASPDNNTTSTPDNTTTPPVDNDATIKAELIAKVGLPFRLWKTEGMSLWRITILENSVEREYSNSMEGQFIEKSLSWEIENGELVITGEWNETFTLDLDKMEATSKTDGKVYSIVKGDS
jgi:hypothetical protein